MLESGWYPPGAEFDPNAPYNQQDIPEETFDLQFFQTLCKDTTVTTSDYEPVVDTDEDGTYAYTDVSDTDWSTAFHNNHMGIIELLDECKSMATDWYNFYKEEANTPENRRILSKYKRIIEECEGWTLDCEDFNR